jgi:hypothetical protein
MIGTTRSRVSFFMNKFRKLGLIDYNGSIEIHSCRTGHGFCGVQRCTQPQAAVSTLAAHDAGPQ